MNRRPQVTDLLVIVGAGISRELPSGAPDFEAIRDTFLGLALNESEPIGIDTNRLSPEQIFDALDDGRPRTQEEIRRELWWQCETKTPNRNHAVLARLIEAGAKVWTPNFDTMIERAGATLGIEIEPITPSTGLQGESRNQLLKPHGSFPWPGQPPSEPRRHDYDLLFQASRVWQVDAEWERRLREDVRGRHVFLFGYRGADPDLTPAILDTLEQADSATWWEFPAKDDEGNFARLQRILDPRIIDLKAGDPSAELQNLAAHFVEVPEMTPERPLPSRPSEIPDYHPTNVAKAKAAGMVWGAASAWRQLLEALRHDEGFDRRRIALILMRSLAFDRAAARPPVVLGLSLAIRSGRLSGEGEQSAVDVYASLIDSRPIRASDIRAMETLRSSEPERPSILVRLASIAKLHGELRSARADAERALELVDSEPALEAMIIYNLAWIYRQQGEFGLRARLLERLDERRSHIGLNWGAWLATDDLLLELQFGRTESARRLADDQFMKFAEERIGHQMFEQDASIARALLEWHRFGPDRGAGPLEKSYERVPVRPLVAPRFSSVANLILLADNRRATGDQAAMHGFLKKANRRARSQFQGFQIRLVAATATADHSKLRALKDEAAGQSYGLIAETATAVLDSLDGRSQRAKRICFRSDLPLPALY